MSDRKLDPGQEKVAAAIAVLRNAPIRSWHGVDNDDVLFVRDQAARVLTARDVLTSTSPTRSTGPKKTGKTDGCRHPIGNLIGGRCALCGATVPSRR